MPVNTTALRALCWSVMYGASKMPDSWLEKIPFVGRLYREDDDKNERRGRNHGDDRHHRRGHSSRRLSYDERDYRYGEDGSLHRRSQRGSKKSRSYRHRSDRPQSDGEYEGLDGSSRDLPPRMYNPAEYARPEGSIAVPIWAPVQYAQAAAPVASPAFGVSNASAYNTHSPAGPAAGTYVPYSEIYAGDPTRGQPGPNSAQAAAMNAYPPASSVFGGYAVPLDPRSAQVLPAQDPVAVLYPDEESHSGSSEAYDERPARHHRQGRNHRHRSRDHRKG